MGNLTRDSIDSYMQTYAGGKLRTFDKTITITTTAYQNNNPTAMGGTGSNTTTHRFEYTGAANSLFDNYIDGILIPQNALIKFVRNAPVSLLWFRSDLSRANIEMLQKERPGIEFLN